MSAYVIWSRTSHRRPSPPAWVAEMDALPPFARTARHIRARVFQAGYRTTYGDQMWNLEVINTRTGRVLITDNCADLQRLLKLAHEATAVARGTWHFSLNKKAVQ